MMKLLQLLNHRDSSRLLALGMTLPLMSLRASVDEGVHRRVPILT